jgi:GAF domain-containing protein
MASPTKTELTARVEALQKSLDQALARHAQLEAKLTEALDQQTATGEILRAISSSPTDDQAVFDAIVRSAVRLCHAAIAAVFRTDGRILYHPANYGGTPQALALIRAQYPRPLDMATTPGMAILTRSIVHVPDVDDPSATTSVREVGRVVGFRSVVAVPMLREDDGAGAIVVGRREPGRFSDAEVELLKTFADQAVIAIENVRLFKELEARNAELTDALGRQTATSDILRVIASSPTDVQPVFETILDNATRLCDAQRGGLFLFDGDTYRAVAFRGTTAEIVQHHTQGPIRPGPNTALGRIASELGPVHIADEVADAAEGDPVRRAVVELEGMRTLLMVPLLREGRLVGALGIHRREVRPFTAEQIAMLETFADQAVIAIENVRLFTELQASNKYLSEALDKQTATSEILRAISSSPTNAHAVFDAIVRSAVRLCKAATAGVFRVDGGVVYEPANYGSSPEGLTATRARYPKPLDMETTPGVAIVTRSVFHVPDIEDPSTIEHVRQTGRLLGVRSVISMPMLREGEAVGALVITRRDPGRFSDAEVELLQTFSDQAVIAIENVRLFHELEEKNRALTASNAHVTEALDRQTATADVLRIIAQSPTELQPVLDAIAASAVRLCAASDAVIERLEGNRFYNAAHAGAQMKGLVGLPLPLTRRFPGGRAILDRKRIILDDIQLVAESEYPDTLELLKLNTVHSCAEIPLLSEGKPLGNLAVLRAEVRPFTDAEVAMLETFADQAVIAIENVRLFKELEEKNKALTEAYAQVTETLEQQTATGEILQVISSSQTALQPVFDAIVRSAVRLCDGLFSALYLVENGALGLAAHHNFSEAALAAVRSMYPRPLHELQTPPGLAMRERAVIQVEDTLTESRFSQEARDIAPILGHRSSLAVPMLRDGQPVGVILTARAEPSRFSEKQIQLLQTFADQAVIAIENVRLFKELQERTQELTRSVEELRALGEVGQAVSSTLDLETVLTTIVNRAVELSTADGGSILEYNESAEEFRLRVSTEHEDVVAALRATRLRKGEGAVGRMAMTRAAVQVADIAAEGAYESRVREALLRSGHRAVLAVPLQREGQIIGGLVISRNVAGGFPAEVVDLLKTFATQSALAIQNARLFREIEQKSRELEAASRHKSEFLANMSHELRTPLNAIIGFSEILAEGMFGEINEKQTEYLGDILESGRHLLSLINDILDLSKIEAGRMELEATDFDLPSAIENALILVRERAGRRGITLGREIDDRLGSIRADERKVKQVLLNLLSNALKFTPEGGRIDVSARAHDDVAQISVTDTGVGIAPEHQEAVFEEFRQVGTAAKTVEGTGLGLTLSRKFIELHGGKIWVKSQVGVGSTFTFTLPVRREE